MIPPSKAPVPLIAVAIVIAIIAFLLPPIPQPQAYHNFADHRSWLGVPNFGDVVSNLPFAIVGVWGLIFLFGPRGSNFSDSRERWLYIVMFAALILTAFGLAYYHLAPDNARLVWDRIPIMIVFMALLAAVIAERVSVPAGLVLFPVLEVVGVASVLVWRASELAGHGDLRFYAAMQVYSILVLLLVLLFPPKYTRGFDFAKDAPAMARSDCDPRMIGYIQQYFRDLAFMAAFVLLVTGWFFLKRLPGWMRSALAGNWPSTDGRIETADVKVFGEQALAELGYSYLVEGTRYSGYYSRQFADEQQAWDYVRGLQGRSVVVRHRQGNPAVSALRSGDQQSQLDFKGGSLLNTIWTAFLSTARELYSSRRQKNSVGLHWFESKKIRVHPRESAAKKFLIRANPWRVELSLPAAFVKHREFESGIRRKQLRDLSQPLGQRRRRQKRIVALPEIVVIHVQVQRQQVDRNGVGKRRFQIFILETFRVRPVGGGQFARLPGIERSFAAHARFHLAPGQLAELARDSRFPHQRVADIDIELEGHGELVIHQAGRNEHALRTAQVQVAMADGIIAEGNVVTVGDQGFVALAHGERNEVIGVAFECGRDTRGNGGDHSLQIERVHRDLARHGVADPIGRLGNRRQPDHFRGAPRDCWGCLRHASYLIH
ncbi:MAG: hypothetical protein ACLQBK_17840 [Candidatus Sulfotelmatobacter sp.]